MGFFSVAAYPLGDSPAKNPPMPAWPIILMVMGASPPAAPPTPPPLLPSLGRLSFASEAEDAGWAEEDEEDDASALRFDAILVGGCLRSGCLDGCVTCRGVSCGE